MNESSPNAHKRKITVQGEKHERDAMKLLDSIARDTYYEVLIDCDCWCTFQIDSNGSITASISGDLAEKLLSRTAEDIHDTTCVKRKFLSIDHVQQLLSNKLFHIQLRKSSWKNSNNVTQTSLTILSYVEKEGVSPSSVKKRSTNDVESKQ